MIACSIDQEQKILGVDKVVSNSIESFSPKLKDLPEVYINDRPDSVVVLYMTISETNLTNEIPVKWSELNSPLTIDKSTDSYMVVDVILQEGTEEGIQSGMFGFNSKHPNASVRVRGSSTRNATQKSYRVKLKNSAGTWQNQKSLNLIKHAYDKTRMASALSLDYFRLLPDITSLRKQFVHLYVKDLTAKPLQDKFVDYGLYEHLEHPNKSFLRTHGLDPNGHFYKAIEFEFYRYPDVLKLITDPTYNKDDFESILQINGNEDNKKLLQMLDDVNNYNLNFDEVFDRYFDRDNFFTWLGTNILFDNIDTISQNFLLYSPTNSEKWFFIPWDLDGGWGNDTRQGRGWHLGIANYWSSILFQRLFKNPDNVEQLNNKIRELKKVITPTQTKAFIDEYRKVVPYYVAREPDILYLGETLDQFEERVDNLITLPDEMEKLYYENLEKPMPFYLGEVEVENGELIFVWDHSYDLQGDDITYHFQVSKDVAFENVIKDIDGLTVNNTTIDKLELGKYYWRVIAMDSKGYTQTAFDEIVDSQGIRYFGVREFYINSQ